MKTKTNCFSHTENSYKRYSNKNNMKIKTSSLNQIETSRNNIYNFRNSPPVSLSKSKTTLLPPCRICGAKASGFHYGVNSCEACKGFFRRALKRPMAFLCMKNRKCDVNGNRRSSCRFCRYKRCLRLGMSMESIKTGRYSHTKRTMDTVEVKRLQSSPCALLDELEMDAIIDNLISADDVSTPSATNVPKDVIYRKQLEYHNVFLLFQKLRCYSGFSENHFASTSHVHDSTKHWNIKDGSSYFSELSKLTTASLSSPQPSSDSGFAEEPDDINDKNKSQLPGNNIYDNNDDLSDSIPILGFCSLKTTNKGSYVNCVKHCDTPAVNNCNHGCIHLSTLDRIASLDTIKLWNSKHEKNAELLCDNNCNFLITQYSESTGHYKCSQCSFMKDKLNLSHDNSCKMLSSNASSSDVINEYCANSRNDFSLDTRANVHSSELKIVLKNDCNSRVSDESCDQLSHYTSRNATFSKDEFTYCRHVQELSNKNTTILLQNNENSTRNLSRENNFSENFCRKLCSKKTQDREDNLMSPILSISKNGVSAVHSMTLSKAESDLWKECSNDELNNTLVMRKESQDKAIQRVQRLIRGYVDFAKTIPGFDTLSSEDQAALLKHAWDEVWILSSYRGYNSDLCVVMAPCGKCFHGDEMERVWGKRYAHIAFNVADNINKQNVTPGLIALLKAVCIVTPDRCQLRNPSKVTDIHWMMVSCLLRHIKMTRPADHMLFPRLVSLLASLRELSESVDRNINSGTPSGLDCSALEELVTFF